MPIRAVELHEEAAAEYDAAFDWYLTRSPEAALKFDAEVDRALAQIWKHLSAGPPARTRPTGSCSGDFPSP
jgi:plasmid stabilization system protein ParE